MQADADLRQAIVNEEKLDEQGGRLVRNQTFDELERYRVLVKAFLEKLVNQLEQMRGRALPGPMMQDPRGQNSGGPYL